MTTYGTVITIFVIMQKRPVDHDYGSIKICAATTQQLDLKNEDFQDHVLCKYVQPKSTCTMAYCPDHFDKMEAGWQERDKTKRRRGTGKEAVKETGIIVTGTCENSDNQMLGDLRDMTAQEDKRYLALARKTQKGSSMLPAHAGIVVCGFNVGLFD